MALAALSSIAVFIGVTSLFISLGDLRGSSVEARLKRLGRTPKTNSLDAPFSERVVDPIIDGMARMAMQLLPQAFVARTARRLVTAGRPMTTQAFFTTVMLLGTLLPGFGFLLIVFANHGHVPPPALLLMLVLAVMGASLPFFWLVRRIRARKLTMWKQLADALDMTTICVEAGLGLDAALRQVSEKLKGPLGEEIGHSLREIGMGRARRDAFLEMAERVDVPELTTFVNAILQAEQMGTSLGRVLRAQAVTVRTRRRQRAEETARKAPAKMVFPLVFCIMPSLFIVAVGPILIRLINYLTE